MSQGWQLWLVFGHIWYVRLKKHREKLLSPPCMEGLVGFFQKTMQALCIFVTDVLLKCVMHDLIWFALALVQGRKPFVAWRRAGRRKPHRLYSWERNVSRVATVVSVWTYLVRTPEEAP